MIIKMTPLAHKVRRPFGLPIYPRLGPFIDTMGMPVCQMFDDPLMLLCPSL